MAPDPDPGLSPEPVALAFLGPALARHAGWVTTQGEVLAELFGAAGHHVEVSSSRLSPLGRAADHAVDLVRWRGQVDVAVVSVFSGRGFALADEALTLARVLRIPAVAWLHGGNLPSFGQDHPRWVRRVLAGASAVVAPTAYLGRWASTVLADTAVPVRVIPNVLDLNGLVFRERPHLQPKLLWMRTFQALYDPGLAVHVLARLRADGIAATLTMAGQDKGLLDETRALSEALGVSEHVTFPGFLSGEQKAEVLAGHDVFLNTNRVDNAPVTVLEAAASGLVVVSTDAGGLPDLLADRTSARLVPPGDAAAMAQAVADLLAHPDQAARLALAARTVARASAWPSVRPRWIDCCEQVAVRTTGPAPRG